MSKLHDNRYFFEESDYFESRIENQVFIKPPLGKLSLTTSSNFNKPVALTLTGSFGYRFINNYSIWEDYSNLDTYFRINPRFRINNHMFLEYIIAIDQKHNEFGWISEDELVNTDRVIVDMNIEESGLAQLRTQIFSRRKRNTLTNKLTFNYTFNSKAYVKLIARHYWATINNKSFYELNMNGNLVESTYEDNEDVNFNTWNLDLNFSWEYAPGSFLSVVWQNELTYENNKLEKIFFNNINEFFENPSTNIFSIKFSYYLDYVKDDIDQRLIESGFNNILGNSHFMTRVWVAEKA